MLNFSVKLPRKTFTLARLNSFLIWILTKMEKLMDNPNLWHIQVIIFENLNCDSVMKCRRVCKSWNETLRKMSDVKFLQEFGDVGVGANSDRVEKVSTIIPGWKKAVKNYGAKASIGDLQEVKNSLRKLLRMSGRFPYNRRMYCLRYPVHQAVKIGAVKLMKIIFNTSFDMNVRTGNGQPLLHWACIFGQTEMVRMLISSSKEKGFDLNARNSYSETAFHVACDRGKTKIVQVMLKNWREFGIDIWDNKTALDLIKHRCGEPYVQIKKMLEDEYSQIDVTESV